MEAVNTGRGLRHALEMARHRGAKQRLAREGRVGPCPTGHIQSGPGRRGGHVWWDPPCTGPGPWQGKPPITAH